MSQQHHISDRCAPKKRAPFIVPVLCGLTIIAMAVGADWVYSHRPAPVTVSAPPAPGYSLGCAGCDVPAPVEPAPITVDPPVNMNPPVEPPVFIAPVDPVPHHPAHHNKARPHHRFAHQHRDHWYFRQDDCVPLPALPVAPVCL